MWSQNKCGILNLKDNDKDIDYKFKDNSDTHSNLDFTLRKHNFLSENKIEYMRDKECI